MMETEMQQMEMPSGAGVRRRSGIDQPDANSPRYTSLKDIIPASHSAGSLLPFDHHHHHLVGSAGFSSANITIKNQLVKHAASVYLQSTAMLANRNRSCFPSFWARAARRNPACTCLGVITGPICSFMKSVANQIGGFWACRSILV
ncbi:hypothetical protein H6P81_019521 [Aristolochia fimbriata]|uniref:Uncharacterized protein n=1 Tax=Aristolochia fimbriata TaxID=158543 RepID=A0AAV7DT30_ARIFI|nr:hypothetical protein H6P81_019521 [Aristolochia fimbriata]